MTDTLDLAPHLAPLRSRLDALERAVAELQAGGPVPQPPPAPGPAPEPAPQPAPAFRYHLVDTDRDVELIEIVDGLVIPFSAVSGRKCSIAAAADGVVVGSVRLEMDRMQRVESVPPYTLHGDLDGTDYLGGQHLAPGPHVLTAQWFAGSGASGDLLESATITFVVAAASGGLTLVNTNAAQTIELGERTPPGARLPMIFAIDGAGPGDLWSSWEMAPGSDPVFEAVNHGVALARPLNHAAAQVHHGTVQVTMRDGRTAGFAFSMRVVPFDGREFFVSTAGRDANPGTAAAPFASLAKLAASLKAGDVGYVMAGDYGTQTLAVSASGTFARPIVVQGCRSAPGDVPGYAVWDEDNDTPDPALMPFIEASSRNNDQVALRAGGDHVFIGHFTESRHRTGGYVSGNWSGLRHIYTRENGRLDTEYSGAGCSIDARVTGGSLTWCRAVNADAQGVTGGGRYPVVLDCGAFCDDNNRATDYYVINLGEFGTIRRAIGRRALSVTSHGGHGIQSKAGSHCLIEDITADHLSGGTGFRHDTAHSGVLRRFALLNDAGLTLRDGAHDCLIEQGTMDGANHAIIFSDGSETDAPYSAVDNLLRDIQIRNVRNVIVGNAPRGHPGKIAADRNALERLTVDGAAYLFLVRRPLLAGNVLKDSTLTGVRSLAYYPPEWGQGPDDLKVQIINTSGVPA